MTMALRQASAAESCIETLTMDIELDQESAEKVTRTPAGLMAVVEALTFVADEPISSKVLADVLGEERESIQAAFEEIRNEYDERGSGLQLREIAGG